MKKLILTSVILILAAAGTITKAQNNYQERLNLPGDNLNLYAVMKLFQDSKTLEEFEKKLNDPDSKINNLDLNNDNLVDYIRVVDQVDGDVHNIILQDAVDRNETQDVAVFTVQKLADGTVQIQLIGDEDLYGKNYIIEPIYDESLNGQTPNPGYRGNATTINGRVVYVTPVTYYEVATWPLVRFLFMPSYIAWHSSWYWGYYPSYWNPWRPYYWDYYYGFHMGWNDYYWGHYRVWHTCRYSRWNDFYYHGRRTYSPVVRRYITEGTFNVTYSHPEQRRDGEELYRRTRNEQQGRRASSTVTNNDVRRVESTQGRSVDGNNRNTVSRRTENNVTNRSGSERSEAVSNGGIRRQENSGNNRSVSNNSASNRGTSVNRSESRINIPVSRQSSERSVSSRSSSPRSSSFTSSSRSSSSRSSSISSSSRGSSSRSSSVSSRSSGGSRSSGSVRSSGGSKSSGKSESGRRK